MREGSAFLSCWILVVVKLLGKYPAIFFGSRIYLVLKVWSKGMKVVGVFEGNDCDGTVKRALPPRALRPTGSVQHERGCGGS